MGRKVITFWLSIAMVFSSIIVLDVVIDIIPHVSGTIHYVNETGSGGAYTSIQVAINVAEEGDTIYVYNGTYYENLLIYKTLNITGEGRDTTIIDGGGVGDVVFVSASWSNFTGFTVTGSGTVSTDAGMELNNVQNCLITHNNITSNSESGIYLWSASNNNITDNTINDNRDGIYLDSSNDNYFFDNVVLSNGGDGIILDSSNGNFISGNTISSGSNGINLISSEGNNIEGNTLGGNQFTGINLESSNGNNISVNSVSSSMLGIDLDSSDGNNITGNTVSSNLWDGIYLISSSWNNIINNSGTNNDNTIVLAESTSNYLFGNSMTGGGISIAGGLLEHWNTHIIDTSNKVNNKPVYYWKNQSGGTIPSGAGQVILANSDNIRVENQQILDTPHGILLGFSSNNYLAENTVTSIDSSAIRLEYSDWNTISGGSASCQYSNAIALYSSNHNKISGTTTSNSISGIYIRNSEGNNVTGNTASSNRHGIFIYGPGLNNITLNTVYINLHGIYLDNLNEVNIIGNEIFSNDGSGIKIEGDSTGARIYHNTIRNNDDQAIDGNINYWDNGYPSGGNYWSDYTGYDNLSGPNQDQPGSDGIGDTPYVIDSDSQDNFPLMEPFPLLGPVHNINKDTYYDTIQEAIDDANSGNTIFVSSGTYSENVVVNKTINLIGEDRDNTIIDCGGNGVVVLITADYVNLTGFTITNGSNNGVVIQADYINIIGNNISDNPNDGILVDWYFNNTAILNNDVLMNGRSGILFDRSSGNTIYNNNISENEWGIYLWSTCRNNSIINNNVSFNIRWGILLDHVEENNTVINNNIYGNGETGLAVDKTGIVIGNNIFGNGLHGISLHSNGSLVTGNNISDNLGNGIVVTSSPYSGNNVIFSNNVTGNGQGIEISSAWYEIIRDNNISFNTEHGVELTYSSGNVNVYNNSICWNGINGVQLTSSSGSNISNNKIFENKVTGVSISDSSTSTIYGNEIIQNFGNGIAFWISDYINIIDNNISNNYFDGIELISSDGNIITENNIIDNRDRGFYLSDSKDNIIYHNDVINNTNASYDKSSNTWDLGYPEGGNFWTEYMGSDLYSGSNQDQPGSDDIGDEPYVLGSKSQDNFPLMKWLPKERDLPTITLNYPINNSIVKAGTTINFSISDLHLSDVTYSINENVDETLPPPYDILTDEWTDGNYTVEVRATDTYNNVNASWYNFTVDSLPPSIALNSPENNSMINTNVEINLTISDTNLNQTTYSKNSGTEKSLSQPYNINTSDWPDGEYTLEIYADDKAGNSNEKLFVFTKDTALPEITLNSPENNSLLMEASILDFEVLDQNIHSISYSINQGGFTSFEQPYDLETSDWDDGEYIITIKAEDEAGHVSEQWFIFRIDTSVPSIDSSSINDNAVEVDVDTKIIIEFSEPMDFESVESAITISPYIEYSSTWSNENKTLTIEFPDSLEYETTYQLSIDTLTKDMAGREMENEYELEFTTEQRPTDKKGEGMPLMYLLLSLIMAIIVALLIVFMVLAKKRKTSSEMVEPAFETSSPIQVKCSACNNLLQVNDIGTTMNVSCPFCSTVLTVQSQKAVMGISQSQPESKQPLPQQSTMQISCPQCLHKFSVMKTQGPIKVQCPNCGISGSLG